MIALGCVLLVVVLLGVVLISQTPLATRPAHTITVITPIYLTATPGPPAVRALGQWSGRGSAVTPPVQLAAGSYDLAWIADNTLAQPIWRFEINHMGQGGPLGLGVHDVVDFQHQAGQAAGPVSDVARLQSTPAGRYYFDVVTCQFCTWQLTLRSR